MRICLIPHYFFIAPFSKARLAHLLERLDDDESWPQPDGKGAPEDFSAASSSGDNGRNDNNANNPAIDEEDAVVGPFTDSRGTSGNKSKKNSSNKPNSSQHSGLGHRAASAEASVLALLLNTVLFDPACPIEVLEQDARKARRAVRSSSSSSSKARRGADHKHSGRINDEEDDDDEDEDNYSSYGNSGSRHGGHGRGRSSSSSTGLSAQVAAATQLIGDVRATGRLLIGGGDGPQGQVVRGDKDPQMGGARVGSWLWRRRSACTRSAQRLTRAHARWWGVESLVHLSLGGFGSVGRLPITAAEAGLAHHVADGLSPLQLAAPLLRQTRAVLPVGILRRLQATGRLPLLAIADVAVLGSEASADPAMCASSPLACVPSHALTARAAALGPTHPGSSSHGLGATLRALARARLSLPGYATSSSGSSGSGSSDSGRLGAAYADLCAEVFGPEPHHQQQQQQPVNAIGKPMSTTGGASAKTHASSSSSRSRGSTSSTSASASKASDSSDQIGNSHTDNQLLCAPQIAVALSADAHLAAALEAARSRDFASARTRHAAATKLLLSSSSGLSTRADMKASSTSLQPPQRPLETLLAAAVLDATLPQASTNGHTKSSSSGDDDGDFALNRAGLLKVWRVLQVATPATADGHCLALWTGHPLAVAIAAALAAADHAAEVKANPSMHAGGARAQAAAAAVNGYAVGERVEVRDDDEDEWSEGLVVALEGSDPQAPRVLKDGYDSAYLWDFTRKLQSSSAKAPPSQPAPSDGTEEDGGGVLSGRGTLGRLWLAALQSTTTPPFHWSLTTGRANDATLNPGSSTGNGAAAEAAADAVDSLWALTRALLVHGVERCGAGGPNGHPLGAAATLKRHNERRGSSASAVNRRSTEATGVVAPVGGLGMACAADWLLAIPKEEDTMSAASTTTTTPTAKLLGPLKATCVMGEGTDVGRADGRLYLGGNLFGLSADDKGKISARTNQQQGSSSDEEGDDDDDDGNATAADKKETRSTAAELLDAPPTVSGLLLAGDWVVRQVSCGYRHTALITTTGLLLTCGHGETGRLGHGDERSRHFPTVVRAFLGNQGADSSGSSSSSSSSSMNNSAQPGSKQPSSAGSSPRAEGVVFVACGREHTVAVDEDGGVWSWGWGEAGRLGIGEVGKVLTPTLITDYLGARPEKSTRRTGINAMARTAPLPTVKSIGVACGREHTLIWTTNGQVYACGPGYGGRLGLGTSNKDVLYPTLVGSGVDLEHELVVSAACGDMHSAVATASGCVYTWGFGATGALGHSAKSLTNQPLPKRVDAFLTAFDDFVAVSSVACGAYHTLALSTRGEVFAFGDGESGALGLPDRGDAATHRAAIPTLVPVLHDLAFGDNEDDDSDNNESNGHRKGRRGSGNHDNDDKHEDDDEEDDDDEDVFKYGDQWSEENSNDGVVHGHDAPIYPRDGLKLQGSGAQDGSGWGAIAAIAAGHLTSAAVDRRGRLFVWGCPYAEDGVQPTEAELVPRRCRVSSAPSSSASSSPNSPSSSSSTISSSQGAVAFRSVGMGGYHTVVATQVSNRWGQPFDANFSGLPRGLQLPTAKHAERNKAADDLDHELALLAASQVEQATGSGDSGSSSGKRGALADASRAANVDPRVGRLLVAPGCGAGPSEGPSGSMFDHPGRTHQALFVSPTIGKLKAKKAK